jgi:hypothetical protein
MESSELTGERLKQIGYGSKKCSSGYSKTNRVFQEVLGLGWVYLATEGILLLLAT